MMAAPSERVVLVAHHLAEVRDRFAAAIADARHACVGVQSEAEARAAAVDQTRRPHLALIDVGLADDPVGFARDVRQGGETPLPTLVFAGSVTSAALVPALAPLGIGYINDFAAPPQIVPALVPYLFPDSFNRRASTRVAVGLPVSYRVGQTTAGAVTLDVGHGGLAIRTIAPLTRGTPLRVRLRLPGSPADVEAAGRVVWSDPKVGMGVQFENVSQEDQRAIDEFVEGSADAV
jgi:uncharacterized protein (TIGR02266 family)